MKSRIMMVAAMLGLLATACNKDEVTPQDDMTIKTPITINASYGNGNNGSKVQYTESGSTISATWQTGDQLLVVYNNNVNTLTLSTGAGTANATFTGTISGTPSEGATLVCYVKDQNTPSGTVTVNGDGSYIYTSDAFLNQNGTLAGAARLNLYCGWTRYSSTSDINCSVGVNTSMMKFNISGLSLDAGQTATIAYKSDGNEVAKATFTVALGDNLIYLTIPAGKYTGVQSLVYTCGEAEISETLSSTQANFTSGQTYSKNIEFLVPHTTPLTFEAKTAGSTVSFNKQGRSINLEYKVNGGSWTTYSDAITLENVGDKVSFRGNNTSFGKRSSPYVGFSCTGQCYVYGNIMSLLYSAEIDFATATTLPSNYIFSGLFNNTPIYNHPSKTLLLPATTLTTGCYNNMFYHCTNLTSAPILPATTLAEYCYSHMFAGCSNLISAPVLPATTLAEGCYFGMFTNCTSLTTAPNLPATILENGCYQYMFSSCSTLTVAPVLPATSLADNCYNSMFSSCTNLTTPPALPATTLAKGCYEGMFQNSGLTSAPALPATTLTNSCYKNMFGGCEGLTSAPALPATTLANQCYSGMFATSHNLTSAPSLPATTLADSCYYRMFLNCPLTYAPVLSATTLTNYCYGEMFSYCYSLRNVVCLATNISATGCTTNWLRDVATTSGTFTKASSMSGWTTGANGIPSGWTVNNQ